MPIDIVDIFAGPGGLGEGFSTVRDNEGNRVFNIVNSVEEKNFECQTLRLRSFCRKLTDLNHYDDYLSYLSSPTASSFENLKNNYPDIWAEVDAEIIEISLNQVSQVSVIKTIQKRLHTDRPLILIGGPPCQAYSLVGRARNSKHIRNNDEEWQMDKRRTLYKRYLYFVKKLMPDVFVMENVKGILSATVEDELVFSKVKNDLKTIGGGYKLYSLVVDKEPKELNANDFIIQSENYGIPQRRHRVIVLGVSKRIAHRPSVLEPCYKNKTVEQCIGDLPKLRSSFSDREKGYLKDVETWKAFVSDQLIKYGKNGTVAMTGLPESVGGEWASYSGKMGQDREWYQPITINGIPNHESRSHIAKDIERYIYCALMANEYGTSPRVDELPVDLLPEHRNVSFLKNQERSTRVDVAFSDRFRVQLRDEPSTTITSHISKDGHYYIHYDPLQARSLTVREAARLQTFPDDYRFEGTRTSQYHQVGNAVPPYLAYQIAKIVSELFG